MDRLLSSGVPLLILGSRGILLGFLFELLPGILGFLLFLSLGEIRLLGSLVGRLGLNVQSLGAGLARPLLAGVGACWDRMAGAGGNLLEFHEARRC